MSRSINSAGPGVRLVQTITRGDPDTVKLVAENTHAYSVIVHVAVTGSLFTDYKGQSSPLELQIPPHVRTPARARARSVRSIKHAHKHSSMACAPPSHLRTGHGHHWQRRLSRRSSDPVGLPPSDHQVKQVRSTRVKGPRRWRLGRIPKKASILPACCACARQVFRA